MRRAYMLLLLIGVSACGEDTPLAAYQNPFDAVGSVIGYDFGVSSCYKEEESDGETIHAARPFDQCYKMQPPRRHRGIWLDEFEGSRFFEGATDPAAVRNMIRDRARRERRGPWGEWLEFAREDKSTLPSRNARLLAIEFIGRRTLYRGSYGHFGMSETQIIVDRVISARPVYESEQAYLTCEFAESAEIC